MKIVNISLSITNLINSFLIPIFGNYWYLFFSYMIFNIIDWITGSIKAIKLKEVSSKIGINGLINKVGYWIVIGIAFSFSSIFVILGDEILDINISIMYLLGWFTLATLIINEIISILENLVSINIKVPQILMNSLEVTKTILNSTSDKLLNQENSSDDNDTRN